jgi:ribonuclease HI
MGELREVTIYTDGACIDNPGIGGYGVVLLYRGKRKELAGGFRLTTNNRMEIMAAIVALAALKEKCKATIFSDSRYLVDSITLGWVERWRTNGWMRNAKDKAINCDLWNQLLELCKEHEVEFRWVKGHAGNRENERCDALSVKAAKQNDLPADDAYERGETWKSSLPTLFD